MNDIKVTTTSKVGLAFLNYDEEDFYRIIDNENPDMLKNEISANSPLGKAILGHKKGETIVYRVGDIINNVKIFDVIYDIRTERQGA